MVMQRFVARLGFSLVEAIVALTLLAVGLLGAIATQLLAARLLREAEVRAGAVALAGSVIDSLSATTTPTEGERHESPYRVRWSVVPVSEVARIGLRIEYHDGTAPRELYFEALHAPPPPRLVEGQ